MVFGKIGVLVSAALIAATAPTAASAALVTFDFRGNSPTNGSAGNSRTFTSNGVSVTVTAWSRNGNSVNSAYLGSYAQGLGVTNGSGDNSHMIDNQGYSDFLIFKFDQVVEAESALFYDFGHDSDAWVGVANAPTYSFTNWNSVQTLFGSFETNGSTSNDSRNINLLNEKGNILLIAADMGASDRDDAFKLKYLTVRTVPPTAVPEPASWAMMIAGFGLVGASLRRRAAKPVLA